MNLVEAWLAEIPEPFPLKLCNPKDPSTAALAKSLSKTLELSGAVRGGELEALLYLRIGLMEPAHSNVQDAKRGLGAYIHGVLHRMEGDYWNAKYWFDRVRDTDLLESIAEYIAQASASESLSLQEWTGPTDFVDACQSSHRNSSSELSSLAKLEWEAIWQIAK
jgi:hypothetical protein